MRACSGLRILNVGNFVQPRHFAPLSSRLSKFHLSSPRKLRGFKPLQSSSSTSSSTHASNAPFFITTPIYYVNGQPHLGHAYTSTVSDIISRFHRNDGKDVYFLTGTDEHGQKVEQSAVANNKTPIEFADSVSSQFRHLTKLLNCSNDDFIRTTEDRHKRGVADLWRRLEENGQIYLGAYEGWYSIRDEAYYAENELVDGKAPTGAEVQWVKEESYFFRLSQYTEPLLKHYEENPDFIGPKGRRNEVISFVSQEGGLKDLSISRTTFSWGVPVPGDPKHVVYVWLDALANYITALDYPAVTEPSKYPQYWPAALHVVGKDILRFHAVFWPAFLMAAKLPLPKRIFAHGWWTKDGEKMSKSIGNVLDPIALIEQYSLDYLRYFLVAEVPFGQDGDFSHDAFVLRINSDLANDVGNLAQRCLTMVAKNCDGCIPAPGELSVEDEAILAAAAEALAVTRRHVDSQNMKAMCETIIGIAKLGNKYIDTQAPWTLRKTDTARFHTVLYVLAECVRTIAILLSPVTPQASGELLDQLGVGQDMRTFASLVAGRRIAPGLRIGEVRPVYPRLDRDAPAANNSASSTDKSAVAETSGDATLVHDGKPVSMMDATQVSAAIDETGARIREMKKQKDLYGKADIALAVAQLNALKDAFKTLTGTAWASATAAK